MSELHLPPSGSATTPRLSANATPLRRSLPAFLILALLFPAAPARALTTTETVCRALLAKGLAKQARLASRAIAACHRQRDEGGRPSATDCSDLAQSAPGEGLARAGSALARRISAAGGPCASAPALLAALERCPSPAAEVDDGGATTGIDNLDELVDCHVAVVHRLAGSTWRQALGSPAPAELTSTAKSCRRAVAAALSNVVDRVANEARLCQSGLEAGSDVLDFTCHDIASKPGVTEAIAGARQALAGRCSALAADEAVAMDACADTAEGLRTCVIDELAADLGLSTGSLGYSDGHCPRGLRVTLGSPRGPLGSAGLFHLGTKGFFHGLEPLVGAAIPLALDCDPDDCSACTVTLDTRAGLPDGSCRCESDPTQACSTLAGPDAACGGGTCACGFLPPQPLGGQLPLCLVQTLASPPSGTVDPATGSVELAVHTSARIHLGPSWDEPCPVCIGDDIPADGMRSGACSAASSRHGMPCDVSAGHPTYGDVSYDCPPSAPPLRQTAAFDMLPLTDGAVTATPATCAVASACLGACVAGDREGDWHCDEAGPIDTFCDSTLTASGRGRFPCSDDSDCEALGVGGSCTVEQPRGCTPLPLQLEGSGASGRAFGHRHATLVAAAPTCFEPESGFPLGEGSVSGTATFRLEAAFEPLCGACEDEPSRCCESDADCGSGDSCVPRDLAWTPVTGAGCGCETPPAATP